MAITRNLRKFLKRDQNNSIKFWDYPSYNKWTLHNIVNKLRKKFDLVPIFSCKSLWDFDKKNKYNEILNNWKITFQVSDDRGKHFLDFLDNNLKLIELFYSKGGLWMKFFGYSNSLCIRALRAITNHMLIGEYCLRFFPCEEFKCSCSLYPIKTWQYILHKCKRFNNYWNLRCNIISHFIQFLEFNSNAFLFGESIT